MPEDAIEMGYRHVREALAHVEQQRLLVAELEADGHPAEVARELLALFEELLHVHERSLELLLARRPGKRR